MSVEVNTLAPSVVMFTATPQREKYFLRTSMMWYESSFFSLKMDNQLEYLSAMAKKVPASMLKKSATTCENGKSGCVGSEGGGAGLEGARMMHPLHCSLCAVRSAFIPGQNTD